MKRLLTISLLLLINVIYCWEDENDDEIIIKTKTETSTETITTTSTSIFCTPTYQTLECAISNSNQPSYILRQFIAIEPEPPFTYDNCFNLCKGLNNINFKYFGLGKTITNPIKYYCTCYSPDLPISLAPEPCPPIIINGFSYNYGTVDPNRFPTEYILIAENL